MTTRAELLAERLELGAQELAAFIRGCSEEQWGVLCPDEGRTVGVVAHHVAAAYPVEVDLVNMMASGKPIAGVSMDMVDQMNAEHAAAESDCTREDTLELLLRNSASAAEAIRSLSDEQLDAAVTVSLHADVPLTTQYLIEEHPISHSFRHLQSIRAALNGASG